MNFLEKVSSGFVLYLGGTIWIQEDLELGTSKTELCLRRKVGLCLRSLILMKSWWNLHFFSMPIQYSCAVSYPWHQMSPFLSFMIHICITLFILCLVNVCVHLILARSSDVDHCWNYFLCLFICDLPLLNECSGRQGFVHFMQWCILIYYPGLWPAHNLGCFIIFQFSWIFFGCYCSQVLLIFDLWLLFLIFSLNNLKIIICSSLSDCSFKSIY